MPNWIENVITIKTKNPQQLIEKYFNENDFDFNKVIPQPKTREECPSNCMATSDSHIQEDEKRPWFDWYKWNNKYWGTKWEACDSGYDITKSGIIISFNTAWAPPIPILEKLIEKFKNRISIKCYEEWGELCLWKKFSDNTL